MRSGTTGGKGEGGGGGGPEPPAPARLRKLDPSPPATFCDRKHDRECPAREERHENDGKDDFYEPHDSSLSSDHALYLPNAFTNVKKPTPFPAAPAKTGTLRCSRRQSGPPRARCAKDRSRRVTEKQ